MGALGLEEGEIVEVTRITGEYEGHREIPIYKPWNFRVSV